MADLIIKFYSISAVCIGFYYLLLFILNVIHAMRCERDYSKPSIDALANNSAAAKLEIDLLVTRVGNGSLLLTTKLSKSSKA
ncbi:MAG: hypothetical protein KDD66_07285 [Bdellovibrionales bacterium]|nr:hypothetical protein [Bdellovibrionales bacterium]